MSTSERAFDKVKSILGKLDRNIDAARARRLHGGTVPAIPSPAGIAAQTPVGMPEGKNGFEPKIPIAGNTTEPRPENRSAFGRATPIRNTDR